MCKIWRNSKVLTFCFDQDFEEEMDNPGSFFAYLICKIYLYTGQNIKALKIDLIFGRFSFEFNVLPWSRLARYGRELAAS